MGIALHPLCSAAAAFCPPVGLAAGVFVAGVALGAMAAVCPPVGIAAVFVAGAVLGAAVATDFDAVASAASYAATGCLRVVKNAACSTIEGAKRLVSSACHGTKKESSIGPERSSAKNKKEAPGAAKREREMDHRAAHASSACHRIERSSAKNKKQAPGAAKREREMDHRAAQHAGAGQQDVWTVVSEAALLDVAGSCRPGCTAPWGSTAFSANASRARSTVHPSASELLAARAAWRASEVMDALETLKPLEEKLGANIPREAKSCICVMAAAAGVCLDVFKPPSGSGPVWDDSGLRTRGAVAEPRLRGHGTRNRWY